MSGKVQSMKFFIEMNPPTATAQEKQVRIIHGKPIFYEPAKLKQAKHILTEKLMPHSPKEPLTGPLALHAEHLLHIPKGFQVPSPIRRFGWVKFNPTQEFFYENFDAVLVSRGTGYKTACLWTRVKKQQKTPSF